MIPLPEGNTGICVGTVFFKPNEREPSQGRLLLITAESDETAGCHLKKNSEMNINGCVYALARVNGLLAASIGPSVSVLSSHILRDQELFQVSVYKVDATGFEAVANWNHNYVVTSLGSRGSRLFLGDAIWSVSVIDLIENKAGEMRLESIAKDFGSLWPVSIESLDHDTIIGANVSFPSTRYYQKFIDLRRAIATFSHTRFSE